MVRRGGSTLQPARGKLVIGPHQGLATLNLAELWSYRELAYFFVWRDLKVRYKQTAFGVLWAVIQPLLLMLILTLVLGRTAGLVPPGIPYPLFVFAGLVPWTLFAQSLIGSSDSLVDSANLLQKVYFPRLLLPIAATGSYLLDFVIALAAFAVLMIWFGVVPTIQIVWLIPFTALALATALSVGIWLAAINVRYRDVRYAVPFLVQVWLLGSPVAYSAELVPAQWRWLFELNPMAGVIEGFRWALLGGAGAPIHGLVISVIASGVVLGTGLAYFRRVERTFADVI